jgi:hypothetical protein
MRELVTSQNFYLYAIVVIQIILLQGLDASPLLKAAEESLSYTLI